jgi:pyruvate dehydrogenase E1 component alpha subunit
MSTAQATTPHEVERSDDRPGLARKCLYYMTLMREIEDRIERKLYRQGKIVGGVYVGRGQEAIPVGTAILSSPEDILLPCHRDMATLLIRGITPRQIFAQYMGRMGGLTRGRDGNMHMGDLKMNVISIISALAATVPVATGCALGLRYLGKPGVCFSYFGDGATSRGDWHEGVNFAAVQKLPIVYVCNNNQYAYSTPLHLQMATPNVADKAPAYGMAAEIVDGNDVFAVYEATERALAHCRAGLGPFLLECKTFRMTGHSAHDAAHYVPKHLFEEWEKRDPIVRLRSQMLEKRWADRAELDSIRAGVLAEIDDAVAWADAQPFPDPATLLDGVYENQ